jgi:hypothetical protein
VLRRETAFRRRVRTCSRKPFRDRRSCSLISPCGHKHFVPRYARPERPPQEPDGAKLARKAYLP